MRYFQYIFIVIAAVFVTNSCTETALQGTLKENLPPRTFLTIDEINREDENRLTSQIKIIWWGDDPDGYVIGYEYDINQSGNWQFTTRTDSVFLLPIPLGAETADVSFSVRAMDNEGLVDPVGASIVFPIKNSPPEIAFNILELPPDTTYQLFSIGWTVSDPDGFENLEYVEFAINDTIDSWIRLPIEIQFISFKIEDASSGSVEGDVYFGRSFQDLNQTAGPFLPNANNTVYLRAFDSAGAESERIEHTWYLKRQTSRTLVLFDDPSTGAGSRLNQHLAWLQGANINQYDLIRINDGTNFGGFKVPMSAAFFRTVDPTLIKALAMWDHIYWLSNDMDRNITYALEVSVDFFNKGGTMFVSMPSKNLPPIDPLFSFLPVERLGTPPATANSFRLANNSILTPNAAITNLPELRARRIVSGIYPLVIPGGTTSIYEGNYTGFSAVFGNVPYDGSKVTAVQNNSGNLIYFALDLVLDLNDNDGKVGEMIQVLVKDQLGFKE